MARIAKLLLLLCLASPVRAQSAAVTPVASDAPAVVPAPAPAPAAAVPTVVAPADSSPVASADVEVVGTPVAVVRAGPGAEHAIVATVKEGQVLTLDAKSGEWDHVRLGEATSGWMHESLLKTYIDPRKFEFVRDPGRPSRQRSFHIVGYGGNYAADREDNGILFGARIGYSLTRRFAFEAGIGYSGVTRTTYVLERIFGLRLEEERFDLFFYEAGASMDFLPGRRVTPFVTLGLGASVLGSQVEPTYAVGLGTKMFLTKRVAVRWELRDHRMRGGNRFTRFSGDNLEFSGGTELLF